MLQSSRPERSRFACWVGAFTGFYRPDSTEVGRLDSVSKFLFAARSVILVISVQAALIAALLAAAAGRIYWLDALLVLLGLSVAHLISNLSNDYFGFLRGHDTPDSPRMRYTVHPVASGVLSPQALFLGILLLAVVGLAIAAYFILVHGWLVAAFVIAGVVILFWYDAAPIPLKSIGLGELAVCIVWGPLMVGGGYAAMTGNISDTVIYISLPHGLGVMSILLGKHIDQRAFDLSKGIRTLAVILGKDRARWFNMAVIICMYVITGTLIALGQLSLFNLLILLALPRAIRALTVLAKPTPSSPPAGYLGWPLWYHRVCLVHNRAFGWLYILGLLLALVWPTAYV